MKHRNMIRAARGVYIAAVVLSISGFAQSGLLQQNKKYIEGGDLQRELDAALQKLGSRMSGPDKAQVVLIGTTTDSAGSRLATITIQSPGLMCFREGNSRAITFDGQVNVRSDRTSVDDQAVLESYLAHFPDAVFLQMAGGGAFRRLGSHYRTDNGRTPNYSGPYWTVFAFSPADRPGLQRGQALQEEMFVAFDEQTWLIAEVQTAKLRGPNQKTTIQTGFGDWFQQGGQWYPGRITRLEDGKQVLQFRTQQAAAGPGAPASAFRP